MWTVGPDHRKKGMPGLEMLIRKKKKNETGSDVWL